MRPDQHKKKKNSEYKKKHGILSDKGKKSDKNESTSRHRSDERQPKSAEPKLRRESEEIDDEDVERQNGNRERGLFSRRKIESNWDRYKDDFEDDFEVNNSSPASASSAPVGADYQSLRDKAASSSSYFQFTSEKKWEHLNYDERNNKAGLPFMSINCDVLAQSLRNIPLEQRLDIDKKYSIEEENHESNARKTQVDKPVRNHHIYDQETTVINNGKFAQNVSSNRSNTSNEEKIQHPSNELENKTEKLQKNRNTAKTNEVDDFDLKLGFENKKEFNSPQGSGTADQVLVGRTNEANVTKEQKPPSVQNTKEDLEDWLDSILD